MLESNDLSPQKILQKISALLLYQSVFDNEIGRAFIELLQTLSVAEIQQQKNLFFSSFDFDLAYGNWFKIMAKNNISWQDFLITEILQNENPFSHQVQTKSLANISQPILAAARQDLQALEIIYNCSTLTMRDWGQKKFNFKKITIAWNLENNNNELFLHQNKNWENEIERLANYYQDKGTGIFAKYRAFSWQKGELHGVDRPDPIEIDTLTGYETQKQALIQNTEALLKGYPALHVLLYGSRGSGKSSLVKSLLTKYGDRGLRLIEVSKSQLHNLPQIIAQLSDRPQKFIIFVDDLSFEEDDESFKSLKVVLEGNIIAKPTNMVVYATSNRRHLVREFFDDRPQLRDREEIHAWDTMQEKLSFSDRFGLSLTFSPPDLETYLNIVRHLAIKANLKIETEELLAKAKQWAVRHNGRSGRAARQFIDYSISQLS